MAQKNETTHANAIQVDWIVLIASAIGIAVVITASIQAGEDGLVAHIFDQLMPENKTS